jgi:lipoprotein signal peptidase
VNLSLINDKSVDEIKTSCYTNNTGYENLIAFSLMQSHEGTLFTGAIFVAFFLRSALIGGIWNHTKRLTAP